MKKLLLLLLLALPAWAQTQPQIQGAGAPTNPCLNGGQQYVDTTNKVIYNCSVPGQNWVNIGIGNQTGGGGSSTPATGYGNSKTVNPVDYGALFDVGQIPDATTTSGSNIVTCPNSDCKFQTGPTPAKVGQIIFATAGNGSSCQNNALITFGGANQTTITSVDSDTQVHVSGNASANATATACLAWGDDDTTALNAAGTAAGCYGTIVLPVGRSFFQQPIFQALAGCPALTNLGYGFIGRRLIGQGVTNTYLMPTPGFQTSMPCLATTNGACVGEPNISDYRDFTIFGNGVRCLATRTQNLFIVGTSTRALSVDGEGWCAQGGGSATIGMNIIGQTDIFSYGGMDNFGSVEVQFGNANILYGDSYMIGQPFSTNSVCSFVVGGTASVFSASNVHQGGCTNILAGGTFNAVNTTFNDANPEANISLGSPASTLNLLGNDTITGGQIAVNAPSGGVASFTNSVVNTQSTNTFAGGSGTVFIDGQNNKFTAGTTGLWNGAGSWVADGHSVKATGTGTCTSSATLGFYGTGPNVTTTTCTSTTIGSGIQVNGARTLKYLFVNAGTGGVNASSGVVTVLKNGSGAGTLTCTLGTGTFCQANGSVALADGDLISVNMTTQTAETLANVKIVVGWQ